MNPTYDFSGQVAIVTGAGGGIGRDIALLFAERGGRVVVNDLGSSVAGEGSSSGPAEETAAMVREAGGEAVVSTDSVATWDGAARIIQAALDSFGRLDIVVNNAGNVRWAPFWEVDEEHYHAIVRTHLDGTFYVSRAAAPIFKAQNHGVYVHTTSTSGLMGHYNQAPYCAAKNGIVGLSKAIALDMKPFKVRSNCVAPFAFSRMAGSIEITPERRAVLERMKPVQNARLVVALASDEAADVNAQVFIVRGNQIFLAHQGFPVGSVHDGDEWTPETIIARGFPALKKDFTMVGGFNDYFTWEII